MPSFSTEQSRRVRVEGITGGLSEEILVMFFESKKRSGGGDTECVEVDSSKGTALITFLEAEGTSLTVVFFVQPAIFNVHH